MDQLVAGGGPCFAGRGVAEMMAHASRARREYREIGAALALDPQLTARNRLADFVVAHAGPWRRRLLVRVRLDLLLAPLLVLRGRRRIMTVTVDDHFHSPKGPTPAFRIWSASSRLASDRWPRAPLCCGSDRDDPELPRARGSRSCCN